MANLTSKKERKERKVIAGAISAIFLELMKRVLSRKMRKSRAQTWQKEHSQSHMSRLTNVVFSNIITGKQNFPARKRDFNLNLPYEYRSTNGVDDVQLSRALSKAVRMRVLKDGTEKQFPFSVGRPKQYLANERRGRSDSYYEENIVKDMLDEVLCDELAVKSITDNLLSNKLFHKYLTNILTNEFYKLKEHKERFLTRYGPFGLREGQPNIEKILKMSDEDIERFADRCALVYEERLKLNSKQDRKFLYTIAGLLFFDKAYGV